jgi:hypothetical protein
MTKERKESAHSPAAFTSRFNTEIKTRNRERRSASRRLALAQTAAGSGRNDLLPPLELVDVRLDDLKLSQRRLRRRDPAHIREVANSIAGLGYSKPILIGPDNEVIDGETVIEGVRLLGLEATSSSIPFSARARPSLPRIGLAASAAASKSTRSMSISSFDASRRRPAKKRC